jgi:hypothetical protein
MSRTWSLRTIEFPGLKNLPFITSEILCDSVTSIERHNDEDDERRGIYTFCVAPEFIYSQGGRRRSICFSLKKNPKLNFNYSKAGTMEVDNKTVYILLEKIPE